MSKFSDFLEKNKIDIRRLQSASKRIERLRPEDRTIRLAKKRVRESEGSDRDKELAEKKPHSGRALGMPTLRAALEGRKLPRKARARVTRAVNQVLKQKKQSEVSETDLF